MAIIKVVDSKASIAKAIKYITKKEKTEEHLITGKDCTPGTAIDEMKATKEQWNKKNGRQYKHYIQSFDVKDKITPEKAHQIGSEWAEKNFKGHEVLISTHKDRGHIHNHFIINSVNYENGKKFQQSKKDLEKLKQHSDRICEREGLSIIKEKGNTVTSFNQKKYKAIEKSFDGKEKSYILDTAKDVSNSLTKAADRDSFIKEMENKGYKVNWTDTRKYITFTNHEGKKVRNSNLEKTFKKHKFSREGMEYEIQRNRREKSGGTERNIGQSEGLDENKDGRNKLSEINGNGDVTEIKRKIQRVQDRTKRATGEDSQESKRPSVIQRESESKYRNINREVRGKGRKRSQDIER